MSVESQRWRANFQCNPSLWYKWEFSQSSNFSSWWRVLLDKHITGHIEHPSVQQQQRQPQKSHLTLMGKFLRSVTLTRVTVALNSSGATRACSPEGNSVSKRLDKPNTVMFPAPLTTIGSGTKVVYESSKIAVPSSRPGWSWYIASKSAIFVLNFTQVQITNDYSWNRGKLH